MKQNIILAALLLAACGDGSAPASGGSANAAQPANTSADQIAGTPDGAGMRFAASDFDSVVARGPDNVVIRVGPAFRVTATGDAEGLAALRVRVEDNKLIVERRQGTSRGEAEVTVELPRLLGLSLIGAGDARIDQVRGNDLSLATVGAGDIEVGEVAVGALNINSTGAGDIAVRGTADAANITIVGAGDVDAEALVAARAQVSSMGAGDVALTVNGPANLSSMGAGNIRVMGRAECTISRSGPGDVTCS